MGLWSYRYQNTRKRPSQTGMDVDAEVYLQWRQNSSKVRFYFKFFITCAIAVDKFHHVSLASVYFLFYFTKYMEILKSMLNTFILGNYVLNVLHIYWSQSIKHNFVFKKIGTPKGRWFKMYFGPLNILRLSRDCRERYVNRNRCPNSPVSVF